MGSSIIATFSDNYMVHFENGVNVDRNKTFVISIWWQHFCDMVTSFRLLIQVPSSPSTSHIIHNGN
jgi:hypothetical protein